MSGSFELKSCDTLRMENTLDRKANLFERAFFHPESRKFPVPFSQIEAFGLRRFTLPCIVTVPVISSFSDRHIS